MPKLDATGCSDCTPFLFFVSVFCLNSARMIFTFVVVVVDWGRGGSEFV